MSSVVRDCGVDFSSARIMFHNDVLRGTKDIELSDALDVIAKEANVTLGDLKEYLKSIDILDLSGDKLSDKCLVRFPNRYYKSTYAIQTDVTYNEFDFYVLTPDGVDFLIRKCKASMFKIGRGGEV